MQLRIEKISRHFRNQLAISNLSTVIQSGTITAVLGANGAGKSTFLKLIAGHLPAATGRVTLEDFLIKPSRANVRRRIHLIDTPPNNDRPCYQPILEMVKDYHLERDGIAGEVADWFERLNLVGIYGKKSREISKGQRYKVALIGLFLVRPDVWLLDEPFSGGLDANGLQILQQEMKQHRARNGIVIFSTQWPEQANKLADQLLVIDEGKLVWDAPVTYKPDYELANTSSPGLRAVFEQIGFDG